MLQNLRARSWNPYICGVFIGVLASLTPVITTWLLSRAYYLGTTTTLMNLSGIIIRFFVPDWVAQNAYFQSFGAGINWGFCFLIGVVLGAFVSSLLSNDFHMSWKVPYVWRHTFGFSHIVRAIGGFVGGILIIFGARIASGCTTGHGITGIAHLSVSSLIAVCAFFTSGIITARLLYKAGK